MKIEKAPHPLGLMLKGPFLWLCYDILRLADPRAFDGNFRNLVRASLTPPLKTVR